MQHIIYRMKVMLRQKSLIFWSLAFPIILGMMFYFMFGGISEMEQFSEIPVGVIHGSEQKEFMEVLKEVCVEGNTHMFKVTEYDEEKQALKALKGGSIYGYIDAADDFKLTVKQSDIYSSMIKTFLDQYKQNVALITNMAKDHPEQIGALITAMTEGETIGIKEISLKGTDKDPYTQYFYALISMVCLIGTMVGLHNGNDIQADLTMVGARRNVAPMPKMKQVLSDFAATYILYCAIVAIVLFVCIFVYQQDFGDNAGLILLGGWLGSFAGIAVGTMIAVIVKGSRQKKEGLCCAFFMGSSFLGGLQAGDITYILEQKCPIINRINPATLIVNGFKSLSVFGDYGQYAVNMGTLFAIGMICVMISIWKLRRTKYASL